MITTGRARIVDRHGVAGPPHPLRTVHLFGRDGTWAQSLTATSTEPLPAPVRDSLPEERPQGLLADACLRSLELPTAPLTTDTRTWRVLLWLDRLLQQAALDPSAFTDGRSALRFEPSHQRIHGDWERLRQLAAADELPEARECDIPPHMAQWMDAGMFGRWVLESYPPVEALFDSLRELLPRVVLDDMYGMIIRSLGRCDTGRTRPGRPGWQ